jgi:hypothetical protein
MPSSKGANAGVVAITTARLFAAGVAYGREASPRCSCLYMFVPPLAERHSRGVPCPRFMKIGAARPVPVPMR